MNNGHLQTLLSNLDQAIALLGEHRTPDAVCVRAFDTLKQARALVVRSFEDLAKAPAQSAGLPPAALAA